VPAPRANAKLFLASANPGKLEEVRALAGLPRRSRERSDRPAEAGASLFDVSALPGISSLPPFDEIYPTFAENAAGKALHYSHSCDELVLADDSGLVVPALRGAPGVQSARYAGANAGDADRIAKLLDAMRGLDGEARKAHFVCVIAIARRGTALAVISALVEGRLLDRPQGAAGFGYDPIFFFPPLAKTFAEISREEKNLYSHRGIAFRKVIEFLNRGTWFAGRNASHHP
jgi:XTP/dITP diphosphohydrolase